MKYSKEFLRSMKESIDRTGMYMPLEYWVAYKDLREKYPLVNTGFADKNMAQFMQLEDAL